MKIKEISLKSQVICVTHLAQVACFGKEHFYISKADEDGKTKTRLSHLEKDGKISEIARLIGGAISDFSKSHAKLMLEAGRKYNY